MKVAANVGSLRESAALAFSATSTFISAAPLTDLLVFRFLKGSESSHFRIYYIYYTYISYIYIYMIFCLLIIDIVYSSVEPLNAYMDTHNSYIKHRSFASCHFSLRIHIWWYKHFLYMCDFLLSVVVIAIWTSKMGTNFSTPPWW